MVRSWFHLRTEDPAFTLCSELKQKFPVRNLSDPTDSFPFWSILDRGSKKDMTCSEKSDVLIVDLVPQLVKNHQKSSNGTDHSTTSDVCFVSRVKSSSEPYSFCVATWRQRVAFGLASGWSSPSTQQTVIESLLLATVNLTINESIYMEGQILFWRRWTPCRSGQASRQRLRGREGSGIRAMSPADCCRRSPGTRAHLSPNDSRSRHTQPAGSKVLLLKKKYRPEGHAGHLDNHV